MTIDTTDSIDVAAWGRFAEAQAPSYDDVVLIEGLLPAPARIAELVDEAVRAATAQMRHDLRIRGFRQGALDYRLTDQLCLTPAGTDTAPQWLARVAGDPGACVSISDLSAWSLDLADWVQPLFRTLLADDRDELLSGGDVYTFVGDREWTPFGIHKDAEPSLILHLGPADKEVWVWPTGAIDPQTLPRNPSYAQISFDFDLIASAERFLLRPGDFLNIPKERFHLFRNLGPSALLGFSLYPTDNEVDIRAVVTRTFWNVVSQDLKAEEMITSADDLSRRVSRSLDRFTGVGRFDEALSHELRRNEALRRTYGYASRPRECALPSGSAPASGDFRWAYPGVIEPVETARGTELLIRGRCVEFAGHPALQALVEASHRPVAVGREQVENLMPAEFAPSERSDLFEALYRYGALVPV